MSRLPLLQLLLCSLLLVMGMVHSALGADPVEVEVNGVEGAPLKNVREALVLPYGLVRDGKVDRLWLDRFAAQAPEKATVALQPFGYYHAEVKVQVRTTGPEQYLLQVNVVPGPPVHLAAVKVAIEGPGKDEGELRALLDQFPLVKGEVLVQPSYERAKSAMKAKATSLGYLDADFSTHQIRIAPGEREATINLVLQTGERYYFGEVTIEGAPNYPESYLRRFVAFKSGDTFSFAKIAETQLNFSNSERFRGVVITPQKEQARERRVPVLVRLTEMKRRSIRPGVGYGTDTGGRFSVRYHDLNLFHEGHDLRLQLYIAQRLQGFQARYTRPSTTDLKSSTSVQLNLQQEDVTAYTSQLGAVELDYNRALGTGEVATPYIRLQQENFTIGNETSSSRLILPGFRFTKEHFDNLIRPVQGYRYALDLRGAHPFFGSDSALVQFIADGNAVLPLPERLSLHLRSKLGVSYLADPLADFPPSIRFFAGGDQSVRAFSYQSLGPKNAQGQVVGGRDLLVGSVELERALYQNWGVSLFHDAGNAFNSFTNVRLYQGAGVGLHYYTPVGGLHLDVAKRLETSRQIYYIHFNVGFQF